MASRAELKERAKDCLKKYYWWAFLASFLAGLLGGSMEASGNSSVNFSIDLTQKMVSEEGMHHGISRIFSDLNPAMMFAVLSVTSVVMILAWVASACWGAFVGNVVRVGGCRFFMESREKMDSAGIGKLFFGFEKGKYLNVVKTMFLRDVFIVLWTLLLIIPGLIKHYQYVMVPYILSDEPTMDYRDALSLSKEMMDGYKWEYFVLELSFFGWYILGALCCGIGVWFVNPYVEATVAEFYAERRKEVWNVVNIPSGVY